MIKSTRQLIISQKNLIKIYRLSNGKNPNTITKILEAILADFRIDRARYHGSDLEGTSIVRLFHNTDKICNECLKEINKIVTNGGKS